MVWLEPLSIGDRKSNGAFLASGQRLGYNPADLGWMELVILLRWRVSMLPTALVYSSHDRCNYIHNDWIVQRALAGNKQLLFLPMSEREVDGDEYRRQRFSWGTFEWYFRYYKEYGLNAFPFYWSRGISRDDVDLLMEYLWSAEVVVLGGGTPHVGRDRFRFLGAKYYNEPGCFGRILHERQARGLLTVGFSAGVDQLCQFMSVGSYYWLPDETGFGLARDVIAISHFEYGREENLSELANRYQHCLVFGLPNDSGLAISDGRLPSGNLWQVIHFIIDNSWDRVRDQWHIKTRQGMKIQHNYADGRHWAFNGGDYLVRIQSPDHSFCEIFTVPVWGPVKNYWTQAETHYQNVEHILSSY